MQPTNREQGTLFYAVAFDKQGTSVNSYGGTTTAFAQQFTTRAQFVHLRGGESIQAARLEGQHIQVIRVRASANTESVTTDWRIRNTRTSEVFNIRDIERGTGRLYIDFLCEKGVAA